MRDLLRALARKPKNGEYLEIRLERIVTTHVRVHNGLIERARIVEEQGGYVRVLHPKTSWWFCSFQGWDGLKEKVELGLHSVALLPKGATWVASGEALEDERIFSPREDFREKPLEEKIRLLLEYSRLVREASPYVVSSVVEYRDEWRSVYFANSEGVVLFWEKPDVSLSFVATARSGDAIEVYRDGVAGKAGVELVRHRDSLADRGGKQA
ncbi:MAG: hypothetical protein N2205_01500, partial [Candidatus Caldatribacterium sp.]|nr:hypothetical protein [Candidatus Caldatribacterium sp.]